MAQELLGLIIGFARHHSPEWVLNRQTMAGGVCLLAKTGCWTMEQRRSIMIFYG